MLCALHTKTYFNMSKKKFISTLLLISILFISQALTPPKEVKRNLKVLPKDMPKEEADKYRPMFRD